LGRSHDLGNTGRDRLSLRHGNHDVHFQSLKLTQTTPRFASPSVRTSFS
jgi:hypothetical protein